jgi:hypothetical protein
MYYQFGIQVLSQYLLKGGRKSRKIVLMGPISAPNFSQKKTKNPYHFPKTRVVTVLIN